MGRFDDLSDLDFELLVADLLGRERKLAFEAFARGADAGVDLRARRGSRIHVIQCKHYANSTWSQLHAAAKREKTKLDALKKPPATYRFVTSRRLTARNKDALVKALSPHLKRPDHVYGEHDLELLLNRHPEVERQHVKLWLRSIGPLERVLRAGAYERTEALLTDIREAIPRYVQTASFREAAQILADSRVCIIAGPPGVGKTTLARLLLLYSAEAGYSPYELLSDIEEGWDLFDPSTPQVFYFDDFLGRTSLFEGIASNPRSLRRFINRVAKSETSRMILTTREYVLQRARIKSEELSRHAFNAHRFLLRLEHYTRFEKAHIFYNHIFFAPQVDQHARASLLSDRAYFDVIDHPGYSPRLIEWMTGWAGQRLSGRDKRQYAEFCVQVLDRPAALWEHAFEQGLDDHARSILVALASMPARVHADDLEVAFEQLCSVRAVALRNRAYERALKVLDDSFTRTTTVGGDPFVGALNPSLIDFLKDHLANSPTEIDEAISAAHYFEQLSWLWLTLIERRAPSKVQAKAIAQAVRRTIDSAAVRQPPSIYSALGESATARLERVIEVARWCATSDHLRAELRSWLGGEAKKAAEALPNTGVVFDPVYTELAVAMTNARIGARALITRLKAILLQRSRTPKAYLRLSQLRVAAPRQFPLREWADLQDRFANYAEEALEYGPDELEDLADLDELEEVATELGISLDEDAVYWAREAIEEALSEQAADALEQIDPDPDLDEDRSETWKSERLEDARIDALFSRLS